MLRISWRDKVKNTEVLSRIRLKATQFYNSIARLKMAYTRHVPRESSGISAVLMSEGKINCVRSRGRPRKSWIDYIKEWINVKYYSEIKTGAKDGNH